MRSRSCLRRCKCHLNGLGSKPCASLSATQGQNLFPNIVIASSKSQSCGASHHFPATDVNIDNLQCVIRLHEWYFTPFPDILLLVSMVTLEAGLHHAKMSESVA